MQLRREVASIEGSLCHKCATLLHLTFKTPERQKCYYFTDEESEAQSLPAHQGPPWDPSQDHTLPQPLYLPPPRGAPAPPLASALTSQAGCLAWGCVAFSGLRGWCPHLAQGSAMAKGKELGTKAWVQIPLYGSLAVGPQPLGGI